MITFDATAQAAIDSRNRSVCYLVEMDFSTGTQYWSTWTTPLTVDGHVYTAVGGGIAEVSQIAESENGQPDKMVFAFSIVNSAMLAACIGPATVYRGKAVRMYLQMLTDTGAVAGAKVLRWQGKMADTKIPKSTGRLENFGKGKIEIHCFRSGMEKLRNYDGLRLTDAQQQDEYAGDLGLQYMADLIQNPVQWLSVAFQQQ